MLRKFAVNTISPLAIAAICALAVPRFAAAQEHHPPGRPVPATRPAVVPHGPPPGAHFGPPAVSVVPGGPPGAREQFVFRGRPFHPIPFARRYVYPAGWGYRRWEVGAFLPPLFLVPDYYYADYDALGLPPPDPGFQWVQYGPDLLLVNVATGEVVDVAYDVFY
jgi:Nickel/cobalt transporter regulator